MESGHEDFQRNLDVQRDLEAAQSAIRHFHAGMLEFQAACVRGDEKSAEKARHRVVGSVEAQLDALAAAYLRMAA
jgi:hypothetical protein